MSGSKVAVLISGRGSNLMSLIKETRKAEFPAEIVLVISNQASAKGLQYARDAGIEQHVIDHRAFETRDDFEDALHGALVHKKIEYVCLAGFMRMLSANFVDKWRERIINIHPSLLPSFKGLNVHERMIDAGVKIAGCTVHLVSAEMDAGPIIGQAAVPVLPDDDAGSLAKRILSQEHLLYPVCLKLLVGGNARLSGGVIRYDSSIASSSNLINPPM